ncbi:penicillin-binding protein 1C [Pseudochrobactrum sp. MP213Fo]|uniref:penicillin-binding protein 1C n=1 Tax=Pseudochrobactrum sp. MP213Fo TaxID=3022250 RepID=UPI003BA32ABA
MRRTGLFASVSMAVILATGISVWIGFELFDKAFPPPLEKAQITSKQVLDRDGNLLRAFAVPSGHWRLTTTAQDVDPQFIEMLIAYEDQRFREHSGIDPHAMGRAALQFITHGRIISGGSTLSMQVARLIEPRSGRSLFAKLRQMVRAIQIERRLNKQQILDAYLTLAPFGGNLEGVRAASLSYFGKEPRRLTTSEAALLIALPQLPERRRPDRYPDNARAARDRVLNRLSVVSMIGKDEADRAAHLPVPTRRIAMPALAAHVSEAALRKDPAANLHQVTLKRSVQQALETVAQDSATRLGPKISVAMVMADAVSGEIIGEVGSSNYFDSSRSGWIDMTNVQRSPGSALKPFIFGLAFEDGLVMQETIIEDRPTNFSGYRPRNFDMSYQGDVTVREALQLSLNVPSVRLLDSVGATRLMVRMRRAEVKTTLPPGETPGLAIGLGGLGISLKDLVQLYTALSNRGRPVIISDGVDGRIIDGTAVLSGEPLLQPAAAWQVADVLAGVKPPLGSLQRGLAYKTGTSYGYRDAWSVGFDGRYVLGVWVGRADNGAVPGLSGYGSAAPILFEAFSKSGVGFTPLAPAPTGTMRLPQSQLPVSLRRFTPYLSTLVSTSVKESPPQILYPPEGARVELSNQPDGSIAPLVLKMQGGRAPFIWLANGKPLDKASRKRSGLWQPDGAGYSTLTVIDASGRAASVRIFID